MKVAILGGFGLVGQELYKLLLVDQRVTHITLVGQKDRSVSFDHLKKSCRYVTLNNFDSLNSYTAIFSALDSEISKPWYLKHKESIACFIDKGSAFRMEKDVPLFVPEIEAKKKLNSKIFASPNCTTLQFVLALHPLLDIIRTDLLILTTLQSVSGSGSQALKELQEQKSTSSCYPYPIHNNILAQCGNFVADQTDEELKIQRESSKIFSQNLTLQTTCLRVPIERGHHISVTCFLKDWHHTLSDLLSYWQKAPRVQVKPTGQYPLSSELTKSTDVFISRLRLNQRVLSFMISADNLTVGAAYNAWKIFDTYLIEKTVAHSPAAV